MDRSPLKPLRCREGLIAVLTMDGLLIRYDENGNPRLSVSGNAVCIAVIVGVIYGVFVVLGYLAG